MEKKCDCSRSDVQLYFQSRMSREEETQFQQHLLGCDPCRNELKHLRAIMRTAKQPNPRFQIRFWMVAAAVSFLLLGGTFLYVLNYGKETLQPIYRFNIHPNEPHDAIDSLYLKDSIPTDNIPTDDLSRI